MKANFKELKVMMDFEGEPVTLDIRHALGNAIRRSTADIGVDETARKIYFSDGEVELPDEHADAIRAVVAKTFIVPVQQAVNQCTMHNA